MGSVDWNIWKPGCRDKRCCRSPHGECGLKSSCLVVFSCVCKSLPAWGVWIEISSRFGVRRECCVGSRMGSEDWNKPMVARSCCVVWSLPAWECGLKFTLFVKHIIISNVTPCVGVWIEINRLYRYRVCDMSLPAWECGLKYHQYAQSGQTWMSLPAWECGLKCLSKSCTNHHIIW